MRVLFSLLALLLIGNFSAQAQNESGKLADTNLSGLKFRSVGPAITSGRIADFAVHPNHPKKYYVAVASGGVWKTENGGTTFTPLFDSQSSYSTGCITLSPHNPNIVWVGTGENNGQRSVAYGDGVYKSLDGGQTWKNMGLKNSNHIGSIIVDPEHPDRIYVAAMGPLWSEGGERGVYISDDGGETWRNTLEIDEHTGVSQIVQHPTNPDVLFAAAYQRRRHVFTYFGGGPGSALYKSTDRGETWHKSQRGFPNVDLGRIGLAISPANPDITYAIVEAAQDKGGFYKSTDEGASWQRQSDFSTSGLYYQEIIADPVDPDRVYAMETYMQYTDDGGKTFQRVGEDNKHVDNHALWIDPQDTEHLLAGCDGGIYESYDQGKTWDYKSNLPITQFYKVALDNDEPFYNIYGGTQDNFSMGGPSRTTSVNGIANSQWFMTHGGDGFESQIDPQNPDIVYAQSQYGVLVRYDRMSGEELGIQPMPREGEKAYRWNWDAPLHVSIHQDGRIYFAANKVFRSDNRGSSWEVISEDLSRQINRNELPVMGRIWGMDAVAKHQSTSPYGTIVAFHESTIDENLLVVGTDDGLIHITRDGGESWEKIDNLPGVPERTYVNFVLTSQHDQNTIYAAFNHHKYGDFKPYVYKSVDQGKTWKPIQGNLPERGSVYCIAEDHESKNLLFVGTEFGVFFSPKGGKEWKQLKSGVPTISVRDIAIHPREDDLVLGTFGRGFYVLDDYSSLRNLEEILEKEGELMSVRDPWLYIQNQPLGQEGNSFQGHSYYRGENLGPVALITYYLKEVPLTLESKRKKADGNARKEGEAGIIPTYHDLKSERNEVKPYLQFTIKDEKGNIVRKIKRSPLAGLQRFEWDMRYASMDPVQVGRTRSGTLIAPGEYTATMTLHSQGEVKPIGDPVTFNVKALNNTVLPATDRREKTAFQREVAKVNQDIQTANQRLNELENQLRHVETAIWQAETEQASLMQAYHALQNILQQIKSDLNGDPIARALEIEEEPSVSSRMRSINYQQSGSTAEPTIMHRQQLAIVKKQFAPIQARIEQLFTEEWLNMMELLQAAGAPYVPYTLEK